MRRLITILALCFLVTTATAEEVKEVEKFKNMPVSTEAGGRFEFIQAPSNYGVVFLLDKYTGRVWGASQNYDISLDTGVLGIDQCADIVCQIVENSRK